MRHLIHLELRRIARRRATRIVTAVVLVLIGVVGVTNFRGHTAAAPDLAAAQAKADAAITECLGWHQVEDHGLSESEIAAACYADPRWFVEDRAFHARELLSSDYAFDTEGLPVVPEWQQSRDGHLTRQPFETVTGEQHETGAYGFNGTLPGLGAAFALIAAMLGASFIGADWSTGVMETHLMREPRRRRLVGAKLAAGAIAGFGFATIASVAFVAAMLPSAIWRGDFAGTGAMFWADLATVGLRIAAGAALLAVGGGAVAAMARSTTAGIVAVMGVAFVGSLAAQASHSFARLSLTHNLNAWIDRGDVVAFREFRLPSGGTEGWEVAVHGYLTAGSLLLAGAIAAFVVGGAIFAGRDVA